MPTFASTGQGNGGGRCSRGRWAFVAVLATTFPSVLGIPSTLPLAGGALWYTDVLLPAACLACYGSIRDRRGIGLALLLVASGIALIAVGLMAGAEPRWILRDSRQLVYLGLGAVLGLYLARDRANWRWFAQCLAAYLAVVAGLVVVSQFSPVALVGRATAETLVVGDESVDLGVRRAQFETNPLFLFVLASAAASAVAGLNVSRLIGRGNTRVLVVAACIVVFLSYSRNSVLAIAVALTCASVVPLGRPRWDRLVRLGVVLGSAAVVALALWAISSQTGVLSGQVSAFQTRVISGLSDDTLAEDAGISWREREAELAFNSGLESPILGQGAGVFYRPRVAGDPFRDAGGRLYVHNYFLWVFVKGGMVYLALILLVFGFGLRGLVVSKHSVLCAMGCGLAGVLAAGWVAPWAAQGTMAAVIGALLAVGASQPGARRLPNPVTHPVPAAAAR